MQLRRLLIIWLCGFGLTACIDLAANDGKDKQKYLQTIASSRAQVYTMRGGLGGIFSKGMNHLQDTLKQDKRIYASSTVWYKAYDLSEFIIAQTRQGRARGPIILVGHSLGANEQIKVARQLQRAGIPVHLLITIDAVAPMPVPDNVATVLNLYKPSYLPLFSGLILRAESPKRTQIENLNITSCSNIQVNHFSIDGHPNIQQLMFDKIYSTLALTPPGQSARWHANRSQDGARGCQQLPGRHR